ncbi:ARM repeat-containing protein [Backusella circina FSU 941]|nr:ARM repeat-containing protein [Backusella circina FSU 941]
MSNEFDDDLALLELNRKFAHVQLEPNESNEATSSTHIEQQDLNVLASWLISKQNVLYALCSLRRYLAKDITEERIQHVLDLNILNILIEHLNDAINANITYEIAWILTNLAYGTTEQTNILISSGAVQSLVQCFYTLENIKIQSQLAWAIANISIDAPSYREQLANNNFINDLSKVLLLKLSNINPLLISQHEDTEVATLMPGEDYDQIKNLTWSLGTLCRGGFKTSEHWEQYLTAFYALREVVYLDNSPIWMEACWGLARILSNNYQNAPFFNHLDSQHALCTRLVTMLRAKSEKEVLPILQTLCNFSTGPDTLLHTLLEADLLNSLWWFCSPDIPFRLRRNAILTISNLAADLPGVIEKIVDNENVMRTLLYHLCVPGHEYQGTRWVMGEDLRPGTFKEEWKVIREVLYALMNIMTYGLDDCIR